MTDIWAIWLWWWIWIYLSYDYSHSLFQYIYVFILYIPFRSQSYMPAGTFSYWILHCRLSPNSLNPTCIETIMGQSLSHIQSNQNLDHSLKESCCSTIIYCLYVALYYLPAILDKVLGFFFWTPYSDKFSSVCYPSFHNRTSMVQTSVLIIFIFPVHEKIVIKQQKCIITSPSSPVQMMEGKVDFMSAMATWHVPKCSSTSSEWKLMNNTQLQDTSPYKVYE